MGADVPKATLKEPRSRRLRSITPVPPKQAWTEDAACLHEAGAELAMVLWRVLRRVREWTETPAEEREGVFPFDRKAASARLAGGCALAPELLEAFGTFALLLRAPEHIEARRLAEACHQVYGWAEEKSLVKVAMLFAEAAAVVETDNPVYANNAGWMCRRAARDERAESWYHRAFGLAARVKDPGEVIRAQLGYGALMKDLGNHDEARRYFEKAATRAVHSGRRRQAGVAHHYLLGLAAEVGTYLQAERHVRLALDMYPIHDARIPYLAHDFAFVLIRHHLYSSALPILGALVEVIPRPDEQLLVHGSIARAAAGARRRGRFEEAEREILQVIELHEEYAPAALIHLAEGARAFGDWERAEHYATMALDRSRARKSGLVERDARELLEKLAAREPPPVEESADRERSTVLIQRFAARLKSWKAPGQHRPRTQLNSANVAVGED